MALTILSLAIQRVVSKLHDYRPVFKYHILDSVVYIAEEIISAPFILLGSSLEWIMMKLGFFRK